MPAAACAGASWLLSRPLSCGGRGRGGQCPSSGRRPVSPALPDFSPAAAGGHNPPRPLPAVRECGIASSTVSGPPYAASGSRPVPASGPPHTGAGSPRLPASDPPHAGAGSPRLTVPARRTRPRDRGAPRPPPAVRGLRIAPPPCLRPAARGCGIAAPPRPPTRRTRPRDRVPSLPPTRRTRARDHLVSPFPPAVRGRGFGALPSPARRTRPPDRAPSLPPARRTRVRGASPAPPAVRGLRIASPSGPRPALRGCAALRRPRPPCVRAGPWCLLYGPVGDSSGAVLWCGIPLLVSRSRIISAALGAASPQQLLKRRWSSVVVVAAVWMWGSHSSSSCSV